MSLNITAFLKKEGTIVDVRSPGEYSMGHIPGAINIPLFSDEERAWIGTVYKKQGKSEAVKLGWNLATPKIHSFLERIEQTIMDGAIKVHCWRGGMRSLSFVKLLKTTGVETASLHGGYKSFRRWCRELFIRDANYRIVGGLTGTGKTKILHSLKKNGEQILDLEDLANHRGSAFGMIGMPQQPSTEQFHNEIAMILSNFSPEKPIWIEDESRLIGTCHLPEELFLKIRSSPLFIIEKPLEKRLETLNDVYGKGKPERFIQAVKKIEKKIGSKITKDVIEKIAKGNLKEAAEMVLKYYDSAYTHDLSRRNQKIVKLNLNLLSDDESAKALSSII